MAAKTKVLFVRVNEEDHARITAHAAAAGQGVAEYMRRKALEGDELAARVAELEDAVAGFTEFFRNRGPRLPMPDSTPPDWEGQPDYKCPEQRAWEAAHQGDKHA